MRKKAVAVNVRHVNMKDEDIVYVGRDWAGHKNTGWGNPFYLANNARGSTLEKYRKYLTENKALMARLPELKGKRLACWCKPQACHADILAELVNALEQEQEPEALPVTEEPKLQIKSTRKPKNIFVD